MVSTPEVSQIQLGENRVVLHNVEWDTYEALLAAFGERSVPRLAYYHGTLEIMSPREEHENGNALVSDFIKILVEELDQNLKSMASTTLNRKDLAVGAEPDSAFYIANEPLVRGRRVDLNIDPPPDLVIEVDITHTDINKNALYAEMGVGEFWRYNGRILTIYQLQEGQYVEVAASPTFSWVQKERLYQFLRNCAQKGETAAKRSLRSGIREQL
ncbi:Uma2 family endonuclease [Leptolyngbya sp. NIES-2104]|uniref:Uma2 family endonuclease n=1 Tax=Leptolyngbya sp. NIES-2104 TaxID=1552121 RepID=UPI0006ECC577|nr:Uma2 family endonuclease [Leptolyngbya sp. NIES-2104]GAP97742.1 flavodoxin reductase (ferredoxin-NADPH reductase) family 1 [Leptolyngbya sp. NIES-2104]